MTPSAKARKLELCCARERDARGSYPISILRAAKPESAGHHAREHFHESVVMSDRQQLDLEVERLLTERRLEETSRDTYIPLSIAAAMTFHELHGTSKGAVYRDEYDGALDLAAAALSRLMPVYTLSRTNERIEAKVDLLHHRFANGATQLSARDGGSLLEPLWVERSGLLSASSFIRRVGFAYSFSAVAGAGHDDNPARRERSERDG